MAEPLHVPSDAELLAQLVAAEGESREFPFAQLVERHGSRLRRTCRELSRDSHDAEDLFQATLLIFLRRVGTIRDPDALASWLHGVARRVASGSRPSAQAPRGFGYPSEALARESAVDSAAEALEVGPIVRDEVGRLPERYRDPVELCCLEGKSLEEAARRLRVPVGTVKGRLFRARGLLRDRLGRRGLGALTVLAAWGVSARTAAAAAAIRTARIQVPRKAAQASVGLALLLTGAAVAAAAAGYCVYDLVKKPPNRPQPAATAARIP